VPKTSTAGWRIVHLDSVQGADHLSRGTEAWVSSKTIMQLTYMGKPYIRKTEVLEKPVAELTYRRIAYITRQAEAAERVNPLTYRGKTYAK